MKKTNIELITSIEERLKTIYDPEFPMVDIFTLGLIYDIKVHEKTIEAIITFTTPFCPMAGMLQDLIRHGIQEVAPEYKVEITVTFEPPRTIEKIKDPDLKNLFM